MEVLRIGDLVHGHDRWTERRERIERFPDAAGTDAPQPPRRDVDGAGVSGQRLQRAFISREVLHPLADHQRQLGFVMEDRSGMVRQHDGLVRTDHRIRTLQKHILCLTLAIRALPVVSERGDQLGWARHRGL